MKFTTMATITMALAAGADARQHAAPDPDSTVAVCIRDGGSLIGTDLYRAEVVAEQIMASAKVAIRWTDHESDADVVMELRQESSDADHPGALAYALPYEGVHIVVMMDRVRFTSSSRLFVPVLLAHVMSHELSHVLEGVAWHSEVGVMKAHWTGEDFKEMQWRPLRFGTVDADLIQTGLRKRHS